MLLWTVLRLLVECVYLVECVTIKVYNSHSYAIPGWNDYVKDKHEAARDAFFRMVIPRETTIRTCVYLDAAHKSAV